MDIQFVTQGDSARAWLRADVPAHVLMSRGFAASVNTAQHPDLRARHTLTILTDWRPVEPVQHTNAGLLLWDLPEDILDHLQEDAWLNQFQAVDGCVTHSTQVAQAVRRFTPRVIVLPTLLPDPFLFDPEAGKRRPEAHTLLLIGRNSPDSFGAVLAEWQAKTNGVVLTAQGYEIPPLDYLQALRRARGILFLQAEGDQSADPGWVRNALACGLPVLTNVHGMPDHTRLAVVPTDRWLSALTAIGRTGTCGEPADARARENERNQLVTGFGVRFQVHTWWQTLAHYAEQATKAA